MPTDSDDSGRRMRDTFTVWNVDAVEREVVLRSSDDQYVSVPLPDGDADLFERLADSGGTVDATLAATDGAGGAWRIETVHATDGAG